MLAPSKSDLASVIATVKGSEYPAASLGMTVPGPRNPKATSSETAMDLGLKWLCVMLFQKAICFSIAPRAVLIAMLSHKSVFPALRLNFREVHDIHEIGATLPAFRSGVVTAWMYPCCGLTFPLGSKEESAIRRCLTSFSSIAWIFKLTSRSLRRPMEVLTPMASATAGSGNEPAYMLAAADPSGLPSREA